MQKRLNKILKNISTLSQVDMAECRKKIDNIAKPLDSLGTFEEILVQLAGIYGTSKLREPKKAVLIFCSDNGIVKQGVAQSTYEVTSRIAKSLAKNEASVSVMAKACGAATFPYDAGLIDDISDISGIESIKISNGTNDFTKMPAMTTCDAECMILKGFDEAKRRIDEGYLILATGEAGIGNTTTSSAISSVLLNMSPELTTGRGSGLTDSGLLKKIECIKAGIQHLKPDESDPIDVLSKLGGFDIAAMTGVFLAGAYYKIPVVMDGLISSVAALIATRLCQNVKEYIIPSHVSAEPAGIAIVAELGLSPILNAGMRLGEGTGAVMMFPLIDLIIYEYNNAARFDDLKIDAYKKLGK